MFSFWKKSNLDLDKQFNKELSKVQKVIMEKDNEIESLKNRIEALDKKIEQMKSDHGGDFVFDWSTADAFSIERNHGKTVIGYVHYSDTTADIREWIFYCNVEQHNKLAAEFREYINGKQ